MRSSENFWVKISSVENFSFVMFEIFVEQFLDKKGTGVEHIVFWKVVENYKTLTSPQERKSRALMIYSTPEITFDFD